MQNLVVFMDPSERASYFSFKAGNMYLNRFCIDEDAAFELSGVYNFQKIDIFKEGKEGEKLDKAKGTDFYFSRFYFTLINFIRVNN